MTCFMSFYHHSGRISNNQSNWRIFYWVSPNTDVRFNRLDWYIGRQIVVVSSILVKLKFNDPFELGILTSNWRLRNRKCYVTQGLLNDIFLNLRFVNQIQKIQDIKIASLAYFKDHKCSGHIPEQNPLADWQPSKSWIFII